MLLSPLPERPLAPRLFLPEFADGEPLGFLRRVATGGLIVDDRAAEPEVIQRRLPRGNDGERTDDEGLDVEFASDRERTVGLAGARVAAVMGRPAERENLREMSRVRDLPVS